MFAFDRAELSDIGRNRISNALTELKQAPFYFVLVVLAAHATPILHNWCTPTWIHQETA